MKIDVELNRILKSNDLRFFDQERSFENKLTKLEYSHYLF